MNLKAIAIISIALCYVAFLLTMKADGAILATVTNAIILIVIGKKKKSGK